MTMATGAGDTFVTKTGLSSSSTREAYMVPLHQLVEFRPSYDHAHETGLTYIMPSHHRLFLEFHHSTLQPFPQPLHIPPPPPRALPLYLSPSLPLYTIRPSVCPQLPYYPTLSSCNLLEETPLCTFMQRAFHSLPCFRGEIRP